MAQGRKTSLVIHLTDEEKRELQCWLRKTTIGVALAKRAQVIVRLANGESIAAAARQVGLQPKHARQWGVRFAKDRIAGLYDRKGRGRKPFFPSGGGPASGETGL